jgi:PII-like signaling protein
MNGVLLRFYVHESRRHAHVLLYEWLLEEAKRAGIQGGSALRAIAGYGRHGVMREDHFFELAGDLPVQVDFAITAEEADRLVAHVEAAGIDVLHIRIPIEIGARGAPPPASSR